MIIDSLGPIRGGGANFAEPGDSGAVIVNEHARLSALLFSDSDTGFYVACHIHPVMDVLALRWSPRRTLLARPAAPRPWKWRFHSMKASTTFHAPMALREQD